MNCSYCLEIANGEIKTILILFSNLIVHKKHIHFCANEFIVNKKYIKFIFS